MRSGFSSIFAVPSELLIETGKAPPLFPASLAESLPLSPSEEQPARTTARATAVAEAARV
ncbi:hypothetical protein SCYAM73S_00374 [Streptomyces cyaneofuscatus]